MPAPTRTQTEPAEPRGFVERFLTRPLAIDASSVEAVASMTAVRRGREARDYLARDPFTRLDGGVAHLHVAGPLSWGDPFYAACFGFADWEVVIDALAAVASDSEIGTLLIEIDSPGGDVRGMDDACAAVRRVRQAGTRVVAVARSWAMSAAYVFAAQADELVVTPGASVGALGVYVPYEDSSEHYRRNGLRRGMIGGSPAKGLNVDGVPATEEMLAAETDWVAQLESVAMALVVSGRGVSDAEYAKWRDGPKRVGAQAVAVGMADRVAEFEDLLDELTGVTPSGQAPEHTPVATAQQLNSRAGRAAGDPVATGQSMTPPTPKRGAPAPKAQTMTADELREKYPEAVAEIEQQAKEEETEDPKAENDAAEEEEDTGKEPKAESAAAPAASDAGNLDAIVRAIGEKTPAAMAFAAEAAIDRLTPAQAKSQYARRKRDTAGAQAAAAAGAAEPAPASPKAESAKGDDYMEVVRATAKAESLTMPQAVAKVNADRPELRLRYVGREA